MAVHGGTQQHAKTQRLDPQRNVHVANWGHSARGPQSTSQRLQRAVGNRVLNSLLRSRTIQPKLTISQPDDEYEREADRVADRVMRMPDPTTNAVRSAPAQIQRKCHACEEDEKLQRQLSQPAPAKPVVSTGLESYVASTRGHGQSLSPVARAFFEPRFGQDLGHVRVHTDARAAEASNDITARAFTIGSDIYFARGQYRPGSDSGHRLLGHELAHVMQQQRSGSVATLRRQKAAKKEMEYSRGNDDQFECCYETAQIKVGLELDTKPCDKNKTAKIPAFVTYSAVLGGKTMEPDDSPSTQPRTEGMEHKLVEVGAKNETKLTASSKKGAAPGTALTGRIKVANDTTCADGKDEGCVEVTGPRGLQQQIKWTTAGKVPQSIEAVQFPQPQEEGTNRLTSGLPLLPPGGYPKFNVAQPRDKDCWCHPKTGFHLSYSTGSKCPTQFFAGAGVDPADLPPSLAATKPRPKDLPPICKPQTPNKKLCGGK